MVEVQSGLMVADLSISVMTVTSMRRLILTLGIVVMDPRTRDTMIT